MSTLHSLVLEGDALLMMDALGDETVDLILTDPPYSSGARRDATKSARGSMLRTDQWSSDWIASDELSGAGFFALLRAVAVVGYRVVKKGGFMAVWCDWRAYPSVAAAVESANWRLMTVVVWDKGSFGMGSTFRNQHEWLLVASKGTANANRKDTPNVIVADRPANTYHPTPKPEGLQARIIDTLAPPGGLVVDPFAGSASSGVAAESVGRRFLGFEISQQFVDLATKRLAQRSLALTPQGET